jgi:hypothetical protein
MLPQAEAYKRLKILETPEIGTWLSRGRTGVSVLERT